MTLHRLIVLLFDAVDLRDLGTVSWLAVLSREKGRNDLPQLLWRNRPRSERQDIDVIVLPSVSSQV